MRHINDEGLNAIKRFEGLRLNAYLDSVGVPTIGYGHTKGVRMGQSITAEQATEFLRQDLHDAESAVERLVKVPLSDNQFAALVSFVFNLGAGALQKSTLLKKLNAGDYAAVPREMMKFVNAGGKPLKGLVTRRAAEAGLWAKGEHVVSKDVRPDDVKPQKPLAKSTTIWAQIIALFTTAFGLTLDTFTDILKALPPDSVKWVVLGIVALAAIYTIRERFRHARESGV